MASAESSHPVRRDLAGLREDYARSGLDEADLAADPLTMFGRWFDDAVAAGMWRTS